VSCYDPQGMAEQNFGEYYRSLPESELLEIAADWSSLIDEAKLALQAELTERKIELPEPCRWRTTIPPIYIETWLRFVDTAIYRKQSWPGALLNPQGSFVFSKTKISSGWIGRCPT